MATTAKKGSKIKKPKLQRPVVKTSPAKQAQTIAELRQQLAESFKRETSTAKELQECKRQRSEDLQQKTAMSEILRIIADSPTDIQPVLDVVAQNAARLCEANDAQVFRIEGNVIRRVASHGSIPFPKTDSPISRATPAGRAIVDKQMVHVQDLAVEMETEFPGSKARQPISGVRTVLATPLLREGVPIGVIFIRRIEVRPFTHNQVALLKTFANQAVIALENVRLFQELKEALEHQTATSEILGVIASSPTDIQPALDTIAESAARICGADDAFIRLVENNLLHLRAHYGQIRPEAAPRPIDALSVSGRSVLDRQIVHIDDLSAVATTEFPETLAVTEREGIRTTLAAPLLREGIASGCIVIRRTEVRPFSDKQISLLRTFADQAIIAIENVRLFQELQARNRELTEALEQQTATSEILRVIASSPTDIQPVLDAVAASAARLCDAMDAVIFRRDGDITRAVARYGSLPMSMQLGEVFPDTRGTPAGRAMLDRTTIHVDDIAAEFETEYPESKPRHQITGSRTILATPLLREGLSIGAIMIRRTEVRPFTPAQIKLFETFADQAVIAIENVRLFNELKEALEQQTATSEILGVIASSPTDIQPVLDVVAENAARVCGANDAVIFRVNANVLDRAAHYGPIFWAGSEESLLVSRGSVNGRAVVDRRTIHIHDMAAEAEAEFPKGLSFQRRTGHRTVLATPLLREGTPIGTIMIRRTEVRPFSDKQIKLLETFADQAVIAIENVRLFRELGERNAELREALEHQTATSEVLGIISRSPTDVQPVLDAIVESAARVCGIDDVALRLNEANVMIARAHFGPIPVSRVEASIDEPQFRWMREHGTLHVPDIRAQSDFPMLGSRSNYRSYLAAPLRQQETFLGGLFARRTELRPFTQAQIKLLETFADQAVIAIENVRLFQELKESLEQQTATSEILSVIASSPTDVQPVLDVVAKNAARLCDANDAVIVRIEADSLKAAAHCGPVPTPGFELPSSLGLGQRITRGWPVGRAIVDRQTVHVHDLAAAIETEFPESKVLQQLIGTRTVLATPLLREGTPIGAIFIRRTEVRAFTEKQITLLKTFADQAVIAIENVRLFKELQERNRDLTEALEQQTATGEVLRVIASSPTELQPVLDTVITNAVKLIGAEHGHIRRYDGEFLQVAAYYNVGAEGMVAFQQRPLRPGRETGPGRSFLERRPIHIPDVESDPSFELPPVRFRTFLAVPMLREGIPIGTISIWRETVAPFTERQIQLVTTFADQAVIAIENVRLFKELQDRNAELREALEHQTATSEVLGIISRSPTDVQPVLDAIVESAAKVCGIDDVVLRLRDGDGLLVRAHFGHVPIARGREEISIDESHHRWIAEHGTLHIPDVRARREEFLTLGASTEARSRTFLIVPLRQQGEFIGTLNARRTEVLPFTPAQIRLLETFADQAVIAIENVRLFNELKEALEQQTATSEILGVIASSPTDIQPVLDAVAENAARLCEATNAQVFSFDGNILRLVANHGGVPSSTEVPIRRSSPIGRIFVDRKTLHVHDLAAELETEFPDAKASQQRLGHRTIVGTPLLREGVAVGVIGLRRTEVRPFTEKQIKLLEIFAAQSVIAIENVRLFKELQERNSELREALEHQTATAEVLGIISRSPTDVQPVLDAIVESAARVCGVDDVLLRLRDGNAMIARAHFGPIVIASLKRNINDPIHRWMHEHGTLHIPDIGAQNEIPAAALSGVFRALLAVPLLQKGEFIGALMARRTEVRPFTAAQIKLLETFTSQAVIAIENVRLFRELQERNRDLTEALEQQTATSEILRVIASSPTDIQPVLNVVAENAAKLCDAIDGVILQPEDDHLRILAKYGPIPTASFLPLSRDFPPGRAVIDRETIHIHDLAEVETEYPSSRVPQQITGVRTVLNTPLLREGVAIGCIGVRRIEVRPFTEKQIALLKTFADQAVIAIENVRLFKELQERNTELREALEHQTATSEVLGIISRSPTDVQPVLDAIVESAARVCGIDDVLLRLREGNTLVVRAHFGAMPIGRVEVSIDAPWARWAAEHGTLYIPDVRTQNNLLQPGSSPAWRTWLTAPLRQRDEIVGTLGARRIEVRPFTPAQIKLLETFADQAVIAIENVRLFQELEARTRQLAKSVSELRALGEVGQAVSSTLDLQTVLSTIVRHAVQLSGTNGGVIYEYDEAAQEFHLRASDRMEKEVIEALQITPIRPGQGATGQTVSARAPVQVFDLLDEREISGTRIRPIMARLGYRSLLAVPLLREARIMGALTVWRKEVGNFSPEIVNLLQTFATQSALAIQNARLFREIENKGCEIETANRHKSEFLANMSHELRTPLTAIIGFSEVLSEKVFGELNDKQNEYMDDIVSSGRHLLSLINDILDLSKVEAGRMELDLTKFDIPTAIDNALILIRERATRHGIRLEHNVDERLGEVLGDERKFKQILLNLLSNAVKFTAEGGRIDVDATLTNGAIEISVSDTGFGIAPENQETIFEEFRQVGTDYSKKREGTGLGLTLTRKFVELHGGKIWVESAVGKGSTFTFTLPLQPREV